MVWFPGNLKILKRLFATCCSRMICMRLCLLLIGNHPKAAVVFQGKADGPSVFPISPRAPVMGRGGRGEGSEQPPVRTGRPSGGRGFRMCFLGPPGRCAFTRSHYRAGRLWIPRFPSRGDCFLSTPFLLSRWSLISAPGSTGKVSTNLESQK